MLFGLYLTNQEIVEIFGGIELSNDVEILEALKLYCKNDSITGFRLVETPTQFCLGLKLENFTSLEALNQTIKTVTKLSKRIEYKSGKFIFNQRLGIFQR